MPGQRDAGRRLVGRGRGPRRSSGATAVTVEHAAAGGADRVAVARGARRGTRRRRRARPRRRARRSRRRCAARPGSPRSRARRRRTRRRRTRPGSSSRPVAASAQCAARSLASRGITTWHLRVAEAHVVLEHLRALGREHEPGVEHAAVLDAAVARARRASGSTALRHHLVDEARRPRTAPASTRPCRRCSGRCRRRRCA